MNRFTNILKYAVFAIGMLIIISVLFSGCDNLNCYPTYDDQNNAYGFRCGGEF